MTDRCGEKAQRAFWSGQRNGGRDDGPMWGEGRRPPREASSYIRINKEVTDASTDPQQFELYLMQLAMERRPVSMVNIVTILQRAGRNRMKLEPNVVKYLADSCRDLTGSENALRARAVGSSLYGLQRLGDAPEVRDLVAALTDKILDSDELLDAQAVGNALYGMQNLGESHEARALVAALTPRIAACQQELKAQHVGNALYGIQRLGDSPEISRLLAVLIPKVKQCREMFKSQHVGNALYGLQRRNDS